MQGISAIILPQTIASGPSAAVPSRRPRSARQITDFCRRLRSTAATTPCSTTPMLTPFMFLF
ncbi:unnamed protein product [Thlaspi arvense]|uniref:Uncharacterized protein n=1 Tax=Thlaspi arvense TaxID=13288 RepID=A0AAU9RHB4_THLAR|nr:unnamed protein product [Thlaspi arvense]